MVNTCEHILKTDNIIQQLLSIWSLKDGALVGRQIIQIIQEQQQLLLPATATATTTNKNSNNNNKYDNLYIYIYS